MKRLLFILLALISLNLYAQLPSTPPISLQDIRDERGGTGSTSLQGEAALWYTQTGKAKFNFPVNGSISIQDWLGEIWGIIATPQIGIIERSSELTRLSFSIQLSTQAISNLSFDVTITNQDGRGGVLPHTFDILIGESSDSFTFLDLPPEPSGYTVTMLITSPAPEGITYSSTVDDISVPPL